MQQRRWVLFDLILKEPELEVVRLIESAQAKMKKVHFELDRPTIQSAHEAIEVARKATKKLITNGTFDVQQASEILHAMALSLHEDQLKVDGFSLTFLSGMWKESMGGGGDGSDCTHITVQEDGTVFYKNNTAGGVITKNNDDTNFLKGNATWLLDTRVSKANKLVWISNVTDNESINWLYDA